MDEPYDPQVNDYVVWDKGEYGVDEGWVYFKCPQMEERKGFRKQQRYITIETHVKPKPECEYSNGHSAQHKMIHTLLLCFESDWVDLKYIKSRKSKHAEPEHYSECDD